MKALAHDAIVSAIDDLIAFYETHDWTTGAFARDSEGKIVSQMADERAVSFCFLGAIDHMADDEGSRKVGVDTKREQELRSAFKLAFDIHSITDRNDLFADKADAIAGLREARAAVIADLASRAA